MKGVLVIIVICLPVLASFGQKPSDKKILDSLKKYDQLLKLLDSMSKPKSYGLFDLGFGNRSFSVNNKSLNALQVKSRLVITPSVGYYHKSGLGISVAGNLFSDSGKTKFYQYSVTPSYDYVSDDLNVSVSYTRFFSKEDYTSNTPINNDLYSSIVYKKPWVKPGIAIGYSTGNFKEIQTATLNVPGVGVRTFSDTSSTELTAFTLSAMAEHSFNMFDKITANDRISITPTFLLNAGSSKYETTSFNRYNVPVPPKKNGKPTKQKSDEITTTTTATTSIEKSDLQLESAGINLAIMYSIGRFYLQPQVYLDYYIPATSGKRFIQVFSLNAGITF